MLNLGPKEPDSRTVHRLAAGDIAALGPVFEALGPCVHRLARRMMSSPADAEDATQEVFLRIFEQARTFDGRARFSTWVYRLAVRHCLNKIKQRARRAAAESGAATDAGARIVTSESPASQAAAREDSVLADGLLAALTPSYRACVVLREIEDFSYAQIADILGVPVGTVMSRLARARRILRDALPHLSQERGEIVE